MWKIDPKINTYTKAIVTIYRQDISIVELLYGTRGKKGKEKKMIQHQ
jgi:hypothetical protein